MAPGVAFGVLCRLLVIFPEVLISLCRLGEILSDLEKKSADGTLHSALGAIALTTSQHSLSLALRALAPDLFQ